ncbi:hypothetical protein [Pseudomonas phage PA1C]|uniref:Uncharacterized protein n=2 Tax=root TaxID=1 RepID=A0A5C1K7C1_9CAUD|nr:hypothetical protein PP933_gp051 [Pseudomonas phage vB_PaeM_PS119XW]QBX32203.1 hypothetical protein [Pseudomonas phage PA1C]QEM41780.1 hypothetical protein [Pseudomonas phage vB_PaeM_PS119XW]BEG72691.1 hypothetical protein RVBP21_3190 [Pseudomonas phage BRkr]
MIHNPKVHGPLLRVKSHYNLSSNDFVVTGMAALAVSVRRQIDPQHISISIKKDVWDKLIAKYPNLKAETVKNSIRNQRYIRLLSDVYAECEDVPSKDINWYSGYQFLKANVLKKELIGLRAEATKKKNQEFYDKLLEQFK